MILSCEEIDCGDLPMQKFFVTTSSDMRMADILRLCGKVPEVGDYWNGDVKYSGWFCNEINVSPEPNADNSWWIRCDFKEPAIVVAEESDEPQFPPYSGPKGKQPDGSYILTPRMWHFLHQAMMWSTHWGLGGNGDKPHCMATSAMDDFWRVFCEDTGQDMETYT